MYVKCFVLSDLLSLLPLLLLLLLWNRGVPYTGVVITDPSGMRSLPLAANHKYLLSTHCVPGPVLSVEDLGEQRGILPAPTGLPT